MAVRIERCPMCAQNVYTDLCDSCGRELTDDDRQEPIEVRTHRDDEHGRREHFSLRLGLCARCRGADGQTTVNLTTLIDRVIDRMRQPRQEPAELTAPRAPAS